jgi:hypothetical protein
MYYFNLTEQFFLQVAFHWQDTVPPLSCHAFGSKTHFQLIIPNILAIRMAFINSSAGLVFPAASLGTLLQILPFPL